MVTMNQVLIAKAEFLSSPLQECDLKTLKTKVIKVNQIKLKIGLFRKISIKIIFLF